MDHPIALLHLRRSLSHGAGSSLPPAASSRLTFFSRKDFYLSLFRLKPQIPISLPSFPDSLKAIVDSLPFPQITTVELRSFHRDLQGGAKIHTVLSGITCPFHSFVPFCRGLESVSDTSAAVWETIGWLLLWVSLL
jgi:hypothetical protein